MRTRGWSSPSVIYGVALDAAGDSKKAIDVLKAASTRHTGSRSLLEALVTVSVKAGDAASANEALRRLEALSPGDPRTRALLKEISGSGVSRDSRPSL